MIRNILGTKETPKRLRDHPELIALKARVSELRAREKQVRGDIAAIEGLTPGRAQPDTDGPNASARARDLLNGFAPKLTGRSPAQRLLELRDELAVVSQAIQIGDSEEIKTRIAALAEIRAARENEWRSIIREMCLTAARLEGLQRRRDAVAVDLNRGNDFLPCSTLRVTGRVLIIDNPQAAFVRTAIEVGYITKSEIEKEIAAHAL